MEDSKTSDNKSSPSTSQTSTSSKSLRTDHSNNDDTLKMLKKFKHEQDEISETSSEGDDSNDIDMPEEDLYEDLHETCPKYLIFSTGSRTYTPHQIGIKKIENVNFPKTIAAGPSIKERIAMRKRKLELEALIESLSPEEARLQYQDFNPENQENLLDRFDQIDALIDLEGHIIGLALSPDQRYLYVNSRPWPTNCVITNPLEPPPISQEIDIHVIDLKTMEKVGTMLRAHKAYTPNNECFFIFLDVSENFVGSGAEDNKAYSWERYYGICLASYPHTDVVNAVAFNKKDDQMLITTSDDFQVKIWRSKKKVRELGIEGLMNAQQVMKKHKKINK